ncbi:MAG TPA: DUF2510 domain-containing protein [Acidimicrobiales bacterium]
MTPPGWYPDPWGQAGRRWWDGTQWSQHVDGPFTVPAPVQSAAQPVTGTTLLGLRLVAGGALVVALGALLPWVKVTAPFVGTITKAGTEGDGVLTLLGALIFGGLVVRGLMGRWSRGQVIGALVVASLVTLVAVIDTADVANRVGDLADDAAVDASVGIGLWLTLLGGIVAVAGTITALASRRR